MNLEGIGTPIAKIINSKRKTERNIYLEPDVKLVTHNYSQFALKEPDHLQPIPNISNERDILYICGMSGSGKSYYARKYAIQYHKMHPNNLVYLFSSLQGDKSIDQPWIQRVTINDEFLNTNFTIEDFENSLIIFDDIDCLINKMMKKKLYEILSMILETGRHSKTSCIYTSHLACKGHESKTILNECSSVTVFTKACGGRNLKYLLENYFGLDKKQIELLKKLPSRWVTITKSYPIVVMYEKGCYILQ